MILEVTKEEAKIINTCLDYAFHRLTKHSSTGISNLSIKSVEFLRSRLFYPHRLEKLRKKYDTEPDFKLTGKSVEIPNGETFQFFKKVEDRLFVVTNKSIFEICPK